MGNKRRNRTANKSSNQSVSVHAQNELPQEDHNAQFSSAPQTDDSNEYMLPPRMQFAIQHLAIGMWVAAVVMRVLLPSPIGASGENCEIWLLPWASLTMTLISAYQQPRWNWLSPQLAIALLSVIILSFISGIWASSAWMSYTQAWTWLSDIILFVVLMYWAKQPQLYPKFLAVILATFTLELFYCCYQNFIGLPATRLAVAQNPQILQEINLSPELWGAFHVRLGLPHWFGHFPLTNALAGYLLLFLPLFILWIRPKFLRKVIVEDALVTKVLPKFYKTIYLSLICFQNIGWRLIYIGLIHMHIYICLIVILSFLMTGSRGAFLSFSLVAVGYGFYRLTKYSPRLSICLAILALICAVIFSSLMIWHDSLDFIGRSSLTFVMRQGYWTATWQIWQDHPILGVGVGNFPLYYYQHKVLWAEEVNCAHSSILQWLAETGVVGLFALLWLGYSLWKFYRSTVAVQTQNSSASWAEDFITSQAKNSAQPLENTASSRAENSAQPLENIATSRAENSAQPLENTASSRAENSAQPLENTTITSRAKNSAQLFENTTTSRAENSSALQISIPIFAILILTLLAVLGQSLEYPTLLPWIMHQIPSLKIYEATIDTILPYLLLAIAIIIWCISFFLFLNITWYYPRLFIGLLLGWIACIIHSLLDIHLYVPALTQQAWIVLGLILAIPSKTNRADHAPMYLRTILPILSFVILIYIALVQVPLHTEIADLQNRFRQNNAAGGSSAFSQVTEVELQDLLDRVKKVEDYDPELAAYSSLLQLRSIHGAISRLTISQISPQKLNQLLASAQKPLQKAVEQSPRHLWLRWQNAQFHWEKFQIFQKLGWKEQELLSINESRQAIETALQLYPQRVKFLLFAGKISETTNDWQKAREYYQKALVAVVFEIPPNPLLEQEAKQALLRTNSALK